MAETDPPPGWYRDPTGTADGRYWDGRSWTESVTRNGEADRIPIDPELAAVPPLPGTDARSMVTTTPYATRNEPRSSVALIVLLALVAVLTVVVVIIVSDGGDTSDDSPIPSQAPTPVRTTATPAEGG